MTLKFLRISGQGRINENTSRLKVNENPLTTVCEIEEHFVKEDT